MSTDLPEHASVVVIGGGVIGASIAFHLAESGVSNIVLVEKGELACGSTCKAAGGVRASFSNAANIAIGLRGLEVYSRFAQDYGQEIFRADTHLRPAGWPDEDTPLIRRLTELTAYLLIKRPRLCTDTEYRSAWAAVTGTAHAPAASFAVL